MKGVFHCRKCSTALTGEITVRSTKDPAVTRPPLRAGEPICETGTAFKSHKPLQWSHDPANPAPLEFAPQFWANPMDFEAATKPTRDPARLSGCCGLDGCDGPNMLCRICKTAVGTIQNDCWTPLIFVPEPDTTEFRKTDT